MNARGRDRAIGARGRDRAIGARGRVPRDRRERHSEVYFRPCLSQRTQTTKAIVCATRRGLWPWKLRQRGLDC